MLKEAVMNQGSKVKSNNESNTEKTTLHYDACMSINAFLCPCSLGFPAHDIVFIFFTFGLTSLAQTPPRGQPHFTPADPQPGGKPLPQIIVYVLQLNQRNVAGLTEVIDQSLF